MKNRFLLFSLQTESSLASYSQYVEEPNKEVEQLTTDIPFINMLWKKLS
ncbi:hypothetical protein [Sphingobacterium phlebotomi]|nr:hypothetical protein [Sphingobacterium phlebotomi]